MHKENMIILQEKGKRYGNWIIKLQFDEMINRILFKFKLCLNNNKKNPASQNFRAFQFA
jgi:hypothetical protein